MAKHIYGLDLGSYEIKVYDKKQDTIWKEKNAIAVKMTKKSLPSVMMPTVCMRSLPLVFRLHFL